MVSSTVKTKGNTLSRQALPAIAVRPRRVMLFRVQAPERLVLRLPALFLSHLLVLRLAGLLLRLRQRTFTHQALPAVTVLAGRVKLLRV